MTVPVAICKVSWLHRLLVLFVLLFLLHFWLVRTLVNPQVLTIRFLESALNNESALFLFVPSIFIFREIELFAPHLNKAQMLAILGEPRFKERKLNFPGCAVELTQADEVWFYEIATHVLVLLCFNGDHCTIARQFKGEEDSGYSSWKVQQIRKYGIGQTPEELERWLGPCFAESSEFMSQFFGAIGNTPAANVKSSELAGNFYISGGCVIRLEMRNGRLVKAEKLAIFH